MGNPFDSAKAELNARKASGVQGSSYDTTRRLLASTDKEYDNSVFSRKIDDLAINGKNQILEDLKKQRNKAARAELTKSIFSLALGAGTMLLSNAQIKSTTAAMASTAPSKDDYTKMSDTKLASELQTVQANIGKYDAEVANAKNAYETAKGKKEEAEKAVNGADGTQAKVDKYNNKEDAHSTAITELNGNIKSYESNIEGFKKDISNLKQTIPDPNDSSKMIKNPQYEADKKALEDKIKAEEGKIEQAKKDIKQHEADYKQERADAINANNQKKEEIESYQAEMNKQENLRSANEKLAADARKQESLILAEQNERTSTKKDDDKK